MKNFISKISLQNRIIALLVLLNIATLAFMWYNKPPKPQEQKEINYKDRANHFLMKKLNFSEHQMQQFREYQESHFEEMKLYREETMTLKKQLYQFENNESNLGKIDSLISDLSRVYAEQEKAHFLHIQQLKSICSPEQLPEMEKMLKRIILHEYHAPGRNRRN